MVGPVILIMVFEALYFEFEVHDLAELRREFYNSGALSQIIRSDLTPG